MKTKRGEDDLEPCTSPESNHNKSTEFMKIKEINIIGKFYVYIRVFLFYTKKIIAISRLLPSLEKFEDFSASIFLSTIS